MPMNFFISVCCLKIKKISLITLFILPIIFLFSIQTPAQGLDEIKEKQIKIFQLSNLLDKEGKFPYQNFYFNNASVYFNRESYAMSIKELDKIEYNHLYIPLYLKSQLLKGQCYEKLERWESALYIYQELNENIPLMKDYSAYFISKTFLKINDTANALDSFQKMIKEYPDSVLVPLARYQLALIYLQQNQLNSFLKECNSVIQFPVEENFKAEVLVKISDVLWENGHFIDSLKYLKTLLENYYNPESVASNENTYVKRFQITKEKEKIKIPTDLSIFCAEIFFNYRQYKTAEILYEEIIYEYPQLIDLPEIYYKKLQAINNQGEYERAIEQCQYILKNFSSNTDVVIRTIYLYAGALLSSGNRYLAIEKYQEIIEQYPESYFAQTSFLRLYEIMLLQKQEKKGIELLKQLIKKYPESSLAKDASWKLARFFTNKKKYQEALEYYNIIYDRFPESKEGDDALFWVGKMQEITDEQRGLQIYRKLLEEYPDSYYAFQFASKQKENIYSLEQIIHDSKSISIEQLRNEYFPESIEAQLSAYHAELLKDIKIYQESIREISNALSVENGNVYLIYLLTETFHKNGDYYRSIGWAQTLFNNFQNNNKIEQLPYKIWQYVFPFNYPSDVDLWASEFNLDPFLILAVIREESHFNRSSESRVGARGLMQIILSTGEWIAQKVNYPDYKPDLLFNPELNIHFGCWYLNYLKEKFNNNYFLISSGYNAGPGVTDRWIQQFNVDDIDSFVENIPYQETNDYIKKVMRAYRIYQIIYSKKDEVNIF